MTPGESNVIRTYLKIRRPLSPRERDRVRGRRLAAFFAHSRGFPSPALRAASAAHGRANAAGAGMRWSGSPRRGESRDEPSIRDFEIGSSEPRKTAKRKRTNAEQENLNRPVRLAAITEAKVHEVAARWSPFFFCGLSRLLIFAVFRVSSSVRKWATYRDRCERPRRELRASPHPWR